MKDTVRIKNDKPAENDRDQRGVSAIDRAGKWHEQIDQADSDQNPKRTKQKGSPGREVHFCLECKESESDKDGKG